MQWLFRNTKTLFTGLSCFHKLVLAVLKLLSLIVNLKKLLIETKNFASVRFNEKLKYVLAKEKITFCTKFGETFLEILNKCATLKINLLIVDKIRYR